LQVCAPGTTTRFVFEISQLLLIIKSPQGRSSTKPFPRCRWPSGSCASSLGSWWGAGQTPTHGPWPWGSTHTDLGPEIWFQIGDRLRWINAKRGDIFGHPNSERNIFAQWIGFFLFYPGRMPTHGSVTPPPRTLDPKSRLNSAISSTSTLPSGGTFLLQPYSVDLIFYLCFLQDSIFAAHRI